MKPKFSVLKHNFILKHDKASDYSIYQNTLMLLFFHGLICVEAEICIHSNYADYSNLLAKKC